MIIFNWHFIILLSQILILRWLLKNHGFNFLSKIVTILTYFLFCGNKFFYIFLQMNIFFIYIGKGKIKKIRKF